MYFEPVIDRAFQAGQALAQIVLSGKLGEQRVEATDAALFVAGTVNAYFANDDSVQLTADFGESTVEELALQVAEDTVTTTSFNLTMLLALAKRIICSL
jgi:hypothetical protein